MIVMIDKNIFDKKYSELYAKNCLETLMPHIFHDMQIGERPDLRQGDLFGVEVTRVGFPPEQRVTGLWNRNASRTRDEMPKDEGEIDKLNPKFDEQDSLMGIDPLDEMRYGPVDFRKAIEKKLCCLNSPTFDSHFKYNCLFLYDDDSEHKTDISEIIHLFRARQVTCEKKFDVLFVYDDFRLHSYSQTFLGTEVLQTIKEKTVADREKIGF